MSDAHNSGSPAVADHSPMRLRDALRKARIEAADRTGVVVDLRDAEVARLEILSEALDPLFGQIPGSVELFDRGISQGDTPRLWLDVVAHVAMGRDKRIYRLLQDTRFGRIVLAESHDVAAMVDAVTDYVARRLIEREHALVAAPHSRCRRSWLKGRAAAGSGSSRWDSCSARWRCSAWRCLPVCASSRSSYGCVVVWVDATIAVDLCNSSVPSLVATSSRVVASSRRSAVSGTLVAR
jgi:hypothetical protein